MRTAWILAAVTVWGGVARADPVPPPPPDFAATQYVDGSGCVFRRQDGLWVAVEDPDGGPLCGFPPTLQARRTDPDTRSVLEPLHPEPPPSPERILMEKLAEGLRPGEFLADPSPSEPRAEAPPPAASAQLADQIMQLAEQQGKLRAVAYGARRSEDLCAALGYRPDPEIRPLASHDVTFGLCAGMVAEVPGRRISALPAQQLLAQAAPAKSAPTDRVHAHAETELQPGAARTAHAEPDVAAGRTQRGGARRTLARSPDPGAETQAATRRAPPVRAAGTATSTARSTVSDRRRPVAEPAGPTVELIPASARYVQVGAFLADEAAVATIRRLSEMGYRVNQGYEQRDDRTYRLILAGPFKDRQSLVAALTRLRRSGYPQAVAR